MRWIHRHATALDALLGVFAAAGGVAGVLGASEREGPLWANLAAVAVFGVLVAVRRRSPVVTGYAFVALLIVLSLALTPPPKLAAAFAGLLIFPYTVGSATRGPRSLAYVPALLIAIAIANLSTDGTVASDWIFPPATAVAAYFAGRNVIFRTALAAELREAAVRAEEAQADADRRAVADERRRIAREMHDVVAHSISVMVVQAGGARRILEREPGRAEEAAAQIERTGRETLLEMRRLLGVMRGTDRPAELEPNPTLDDVGSLVARARDAGLRVELRVEGDRRPVPAGLELGAYRVVQDALEDVQRTVPGAEAEIVLRWTPVALEIAISDDRPYAGPELVSVRERVSLYNGELRTAPRPDGTGHALHVRFPLQDLDQTEAVPAQGAA